MRDGLLKSMVRFLQYMAPSDASVWSSKRERRVIRRLEIFNMEVHSNASETNSRRIPYCHSLPDGE